jgi:hypothetical protein
MSSTPPVVRRAVVELVGPSEPVSVETELRYDPDDPYAVAVAFLMGESEVSWVFARDLLMRGAAEPAGEGDVQVLPSVDSEGRALVVLVLRSPSGGAVVRFAARDVLGFLADSTRAVWPGSEGEHLSADDLIAALLVD